jgi:transposase
LSLILALSVLNCLSTVPSFLLHRLTRLLSQQAVDWSEADKPFLTHLLNQNESIGLVHQLTLRFKRMMQARQADGLIEWCSDAEQIPLLNGFVKGIRRDFDAVKEAFRSEWSNGQTEGQVNRLKTIKRTMYGKAKFDLLRLRVLTPNWTDPPK